MRSSPSPRTLRYGAQPFAYFSLLICAQARLIDQDGGGADSSSGGSQSGATVLSGEDLKGGAGGQAAKKDAGCCK